MVVLFAQLFIGRFVSVDLFNLESLLLRLLSFLFLIREEFPWVFDRFRQILDGFGHAIVESPLENEDEDDQYNYVDGETDQLEPGKITRNKVP